MARATEISFVRYAHAKPYKRAKRQLRALKTYIRRPICDIRRKTKGDAALEDSVHRRLWLCQDLRPARAEGGMHRLALYATPVFDAAAQGQIIGFIAGWIGALA